MKQLVIVVVAMVGFCFSGGAHAQASLNGAWRAMEVVVTGGENPGIYADLQSMIVFSEEHYSVVSNFGERPDIPEGVGPISDELALASFRTFRANAGSYNVLGSRLIRHFMLAGNPRDVGVTLESEYERRGDTLTITTTNDQGVTTRINYVMAD